MTDAKRLEVHDRLLAGNYLTKRELGQIGKPSGDTVMAIPHDNPVRRVSEELLRSYEEFLEWCRRYQACCEEVEHLPFPTQAEAGEAAAILRRQRELLAQWEVLLHEGLIQTDAMLQRTWKRQVREWVAGLDEELSRLKRGSD